MDAMFAAVMSRTGDEHIPLYSLLPLGDLDLLGDRVTV